MFDLRCADSLMLGISVSCQQAIVLEGSYWKRRIEVVIKEYHKWRIYYKKRVSTRFLRGFILCIFVATVQTEISEQQWVGLTFSFVETFGSPEDESH